MARSLVAHRRRDIIQSLYLLVFQRSHSRFNLRCVYCHSVVIFPLKFSSDNKKLRANGTPSLSLSFHPGWLVDSFVSVVVHPSRKIHAAACGGSIALNKFILRDRAPISVVPRFYLQLREARATAVVAAYGRPTFVSPRRLKMSDRCVLQFHPRKFDEREKEATDDDGSSDNYGRDFNDCFEVLFFWGVSHEKRTRKIAARKKESELS